jgi:hypothetical protein
MNLCMQDYQNWRKMMSPSADMARLTLFIILKKCFLAANNELALFYKGFWSIFMKYIFLIDPGFLCWRRVWLSLPHTFHDRGLTDRHDEKAFLQQVEKFFCWVMLFREDSSQELGPGRAYKMQAQVGLGLFWAWPGLWARDLEDRLGPKIRPARARALVYVVKTRSRAQSRAQHLGLGLGPTWP